MASTDNVNDPNRLVELSGSDYEIADGQSNIKGWDVLDVNRKKIGEVDDLLFNPPSRRVRYLIVDLKNNDLNLASRRVAIPIGVAELHEHNKNVLLPQVNAIHLTTLPTYDKGHPLTYDREVAIRNSFIVPNTAVIPGAEFYDHEHFDQNRFYGRRDSSQADKTDTATTTAETTTPTPTPAATPAVYNQPLGDTSPEDMQRITTEQKYNRSNDIP